VSMEKEQVVLNTASCEIMVANTEEGLKLYLKQGSHIVILDPLEWTDVKRAADRALNFIGEVSA